MRLVWSNFGGPRVIRREGWIVSGFKWQEEFKRRPAVFWTECLGEMTGNFYESREAAQVEVDYFAARKDKYTYPKMTIRSAHVHSLELSEERWGRVTSTPDANRD